ncbi:MAG: D-ribose pyranase [Protaetiibacter sp.]
MKRLGLINAQLLSAVGALRHTDRFGIGDSGLPVPVGVPVIDLAIVYGLPAFEPVYSAVVSEVVLQNAWIAEESLSTASGLLELLKRDAPVQTVSHGELKSMLESCKFVVRTGSVTPYTNAILEAGVAW